MRFFKLILLAALVIVVGGGGYLWYAAGHEPGPVIAIAAPEKFVGRSTRLSVTIDSPTELSASAVTVTQNGKPVTLGDQKTDVAGGKTTISAVIGRDGLSNGSATLTVDASRKTLYGYRTATSHASRDLVVRLDPPRVAVTSSHQFINLGGAEFVVLRATPEGVEAGIMVGNVRYPFYPGTAVGITDPSVRVGFFALQHDQDLNTKISAYARDEAGNEASAPVDHQPFVKKFMDSRIPIDQNFLDRVVPAIASNTPEIKVDTGSPEGRLKGFLEINGHLRKKNGEYIASLAAKSQARQLWTEIGRAHV